MDERVGNHGALIVRRMVHQGIAVPTTQYSIPIIQVKTKKKAEIQALSSFGFQYVTEEYLPRKLKEGDWI